MKPARLILLLGLALVLIDCQHQPDYVKTKGFEVRVSAHDVVASVSIVPSKIEQPYMIDVLPASRLSEVDEADYADSVLLWKTEWIESQKALYGSMGKEYDGGLGQLLHRGNLTVEQGYAESERYVVVVFYVDSVGSTVVDKKQAAVAEFMTAQLPASDNHLTLNYSEASGSLHIEATTSEPYGVAIITHDDYDYFVSHLHFSLNQLLESEMSYEYERQKEANTDFIIDDMLYVGNQTIDLRQQHSELVGQECVVLAGTYYYGYVNSVVAIEQVEHL